MAKTLIWWRPSMFDPFDVGDLFQPFAPEVRIEEFVTDGLYTMRAEVPGVDPEKDVEVTIADGMLRVQVERTQEKREKVRSEFHYGRFVRTVSLPQSAAEDTATAAYVDGVLEITMKVGEPREAGRQIPIETSRPETTTAKAA